MLLLGITIFVLIFNFVSFILFPLVVNHTFGYIIFWGIFFFFFLGGGGGGGGGVLYADFGIEK
jgi:hypothetical protein